MNARKTKSDKFSFALPKCRDNAMNIAFATLCLILTKYQEIYDLNQALWFRLMLSPLMILGQHQTVIIGLTVHQVRIQLKDSLFFTVGSKKFNFLLIIMIV